MCLRSVSRMAAVLVLLGLAGCGGHAKPANTRRAAVKPPPVCLPAAAAAVARALGVTPASVSAKVGTGNNGEPQCTFAVRGRGVSVVVNLDSSPQPFARLEREIEEEGQQFGQKRDFSPPETVAHLGLDAAWVPDTSQVITTDGVRLVTVTVGWRGARMAMRRALGAAEAKLYLGPLNRKAAENTEV